MREIYQWTEWFTELAGKIAEGGETYLIDCAKRVAWKADGTKPPLLDPDYKDENIDPFSFFYSLAVQNRGRENRRRVYPSIVNVFGIHAPIPIDSDDAFFFPTPNPQNLLFHYKGSGNPKLLWRLFRGAVLGVESVEAQDFDGALEIGQVAIRKLTQALFLINPSAFLPCDDWTRSLGVSNLSGNIKWTQYQEGLQKFRDAFPGCAPYEINLLAYLWKKGKGYLPISGNHFQISTHAQGEHVDDLWNGTDPKLERLYFEPNNWVFPGGPGRRMSWEDYDEPGEGAPKYPLRSPERGDVMLVRTGNRIGRGIGIVYKNDYRDRLAEDSRIHVVWVNKESGELSRETPAPGFPPAWERGFSRATEKTIETFRFTQTYGKTFALLDRLRCREGPVVNQETPRHSDAEHPRNQILYGPPGTGKTYHAVDHALAIIDGVGVKDVERDVRRFHDLRFDPNSDIGQIAMVTFHQNFAYEDFIEGIRPVLSDGAEGQIGYRLHNGIFKQIAEAARGKRDKRFVLIIDEVNRGNIAKIFGELITLIEDSRRLGADDATEVTLPYSNESFGVPDNLYLIGTMNTADRSIQLLDTALRRRFTFVEMMPEPQHEGISTDVEGVDCQRMLTVMNARITALLDREHQIGHTYLLGIDTLQRLSDALQNRILPLLQEYFFDDWSKMRGVLGRNSFVVERQTENLFPDPEQADDDRKIYERLPSSDTRWTEAGEYQKIYSDDN